MVDQVTPPDPAPKKPKLVCPPGAVDAHFHLFGPAARYRFIENPPYATGDALPETLIAKHEVLGISFGVIVMGGAYGRDTSHLIDTLVRFPGRFRGIAVPPGELSSAEITRMHAAGVRGVRFASDAAGSHVARIEPALAARVADRGWHVQFLPRGTNLPDHMDRLLTLPNDIVIDHFGGVDASLGLDQPAFGALLRMLDSGRVGVKLSGPIYRSRREFPYEDIQPFAAALVRHAPERLVWGSDWPHLHLYGRAMPNDGDLLDLLLDWVPDERRRDAVLADNPRRLYGFPG
jgi:2-pyrone-4,6-dicarboxylate lactonase